VIAQALSGMNPVHLYVLLGIISFLYLSTTDRLPPVESIRKLISTLDDRGGNILILGLLTSWFFIVTVKLFYHAISMISNGQIKADDAILLLALNTVSSGFAGTCFGALLKTMTGSQTVPPPSVNPGPGTMATVTASGGGGSSVTLPSASGSTSVTLTPPNSELETKKENKDG
jgi:hypothetical protein